MSRGPGRAGTRAGVTLVCAGAIAAGVAYAAAIVDGAAPTWAPWALAAGASASSVGLFFLGAATRDALTRGIAALLVALGILLFGAFAAALALTPGAGATEPLLLGLPRRLAIVFYGVGFVPLFVLPVAFARTFGATRDPVA